MTDEPTWPAAPDAPPRGWLSVLTKPAAPLASGFLLAVGVVLALALTVAIASIATVLMSVVIAMFLALGLDPTVRVLQGRRIPRPWAITIVATGFLGVVVLIVALVVPSLVEQFVVLIQSLPQTIEDMLASEWFRTLDAGLEVDLDATVRDGIASLGSISTFLSISGGLLRASAGLVAAISSAVIVVVLTIYFLASLDGAKDALCRLMPAYRRTLARRLTDQITDSVGGAVAGALTLSSINAAVVFVLMLLIGSPMPLLLAIAAWFVTLVPMIGSLVFLVIGTVAALFVSPVGALVFALGYFAYIQIEAYFVTPRVLGRAVAVPGVLVLLSAMIGATLLGFLGALVAIPTTASVLIILREVVFPRQDAHTVPPSQPAAGG